MEDIVGALCGAQNGAEALGRVIAGVGVLATRYEELWLIVEGQSPDRVRSADIGLSLGGITICGRLLVPFCDVKAWERDCGEPCIAFEMSGKEAIVAPATAPDDDQFVTEIQRFIENDWYTEDTVYLSSLDGPAGSRPAAAAEGYVIDMVRPEHLPAGRPLIGEDTLRVLGEEMRLGDITWAERETDGDGNRYLHIVMADGRYRRVSAGDLSR